MVDVVIGDVIRLGIDPHAYRPFALIDPDDERFAILMQTGEQVASNFKRRCAVRCAFLGFGQRECKVSHELKASWYSLARLRLLPGHDMLRTATRICAQCPGG